MSRGPGKIQNQIIDKLSESEGEVSRNKLLWDLAEANESVDKGKEICDGIFEGRIKKSFVNNFNRAISSLKEDRVSFFNEKLTHLDELFHIYPFKTYKLEILALRQKMLPFIPGFLNKPYFRTSFNTAANERFLIEKMQERRKQKFIELQKKWADLEKQIAKKLAENGEHYELWKHILIKGNQLYLNKNITINYSLLHLLKKLNKEYQAGKDNVVSALNGHFEDSFDSQDMKHTLLKSEIYKIGNFGNQGRSTLKTPFKEYLLKQNKDLIESLPGHIYYSPRIMGHLSAAVKSYSHLLDKLIDRTVFADFEFLSA